MAKPTTIPDWISDDDAAKIDTPSASKQAEGWLSGEKPPFQYFNWFWNAISKWIQWFDARTPDWNIVIDEVVNGGDYTTLVAYMADSPAAGDRILINTDQTLTAQFNPPSGVKLATKKGVKILCSTTLSGQPLISFNDNNEIMGEFIIEISYTGTTYAAILINGDGNCLENAVIKNTSTGTITKVFEILSSNICNSIKGAVYNTGGGVITAILNDASGTNSNHVVIRDAVNDTVVIVE